MFDPATENEPGWDQEIRDDVIEECNKYGGVLHIYVDKVAPQGNVYVKCPTVSTAVSAVNAHASTSLQPPSPITIPCGLSLIEYNCNRYSNNPPQAQHTQPELDIADSRGLVVADALRLAQLCQLPWALLETVRHIKLIEGGRLWRTLLCQIHVYIELLGEQQHTVPDPRRSKQSDPRRSGKLEHR